MKNFLTSSACQCRAHCPACRTDPVWRAAVGAPEVCPHGVTIDDLPPIVDTSTIVKERMVFCQSCDDESCGVKHQSKCRQRAVLSRGNFHCPDGRF